MCNGYSGLHHQGLLSSDTLPAPLAGRPFGGCLVCLSPCLPICLWAGPTEVLAEGCGDGGGDMAERLRTLQKNQHEKTSRPFQSAHQEPVAGQIRDSLLACFFSALHALTFHATRIS